MLAGQHVSSVRWDVRPVLIDIGKVNDDSEEAGMTSSAPSHLGVKTVFPQSISLSLSTIRQLNGSRTLRIQHLPSALSGPAHQLRNPT